MAATYTLTGSHIKLYINGTLYKNVQGVSLTIDYGEKPIYGIDCPYPQEIAPGQVMLNGSISGIRLKNSGGLQGAGMRPLFQDIAASPYISIRIQDRQSMEDIIFIPNAKVTRESHSIGVKSTYKMNIDFIGQVPMFSLDRS